VFLAKILGNLLGFWKRREEGRATYMGNKMSSFPLSRELDWKVNESDKVT